MITSHSQTTSADQSAERATRIAHLFTSSTDGHLYDTRVDSWSAKAPLRRDYCQTFEHIANTRQLKATLRGGAFAWPGGYPLYFITSDGGALAFETVRDNLRSVLDSIKTKCNDGWRVVACDVNWENTDLADDHTGEPIESAYGESKLTD